MKRKQQNGLVPIGEVFGGLDGPVKAIRDASPQARHHFTQADQVNQLVTASEADPDLGFMARMMALCSLPRSNPGNRLQYKRVNGPYTLYMNAVGGCKLPFGNLPRLLMAWLSTEAVRTQSRELVLGRSLAEFMRTLGVLSSDSGGASGVRTRLRNQMRRLFNAHVRLVYEDEYGEQFVSSAIADRGAFWWNVRKHDQPSLWESKIYLGEAFFNEIINHVSDHRKTYFFGLSPTGHRSRQPRLWRGIGGNGSVQRLNRPQIEHRQRVGERRGAGELIVPPP